MSPSLRYVYLRSQPRPGMSGRPLDVLEEALHATVTVRLKDGTAQFGVLTGYDQHMNVVLEPADETEPAGGAEPVESTPGQADAVGVEDTTIIRGDNVVSVDL